MKRKEVTAVFEWINEQTLIEQIEKLKSLLTEGKEFYENVENTKTNQNLLLQFRQKYERMRSFKVINHNEIIIKSNV
jgi:hypothetical protein